MEYVEQFYCPAVGDSDPGVGHPICNLLHDFLSDCLRSNKFVRCGILCSLSLSHQITSVSIVGQYSFWRAPESTWIYHCTGEAGVPRPV